MRYLRGHSVAFGPRCTRAMLAESADKSDAAVAPTDDGGLSDSDALADLGQSQSDEGTQEEETDQSGGAAG